MNAAMILFATNKTFFFFLILFLHFADMTGFQYNTGFSIVDVVKTRQAGILAYLHLHPFHLLIYLLLFYIYIVDLF